MRLSQKFSVPHSREDVWNLFHDIEALANCFPGAKITKLEGLDSFTGEVTARLGPMRLHFMGDGQVDRNHGSWSGRLHGKGRDKGSNSGAKATLSYQLIDISEGSETLVEVEADYALSGSLAQIGRGAIVEEFARQITSQFSASLDEMLSRRAGFEDPKKDYQRSGRDLKIGWLLARSFWVSIRKFFSGSFGKE